MKQTIVAENGKSYTQEIKAKDIEAILDRMYAQTYEHISDDDYDIDDDELKQLTQLLTDISIGVITEDNFEEYLQQLWEPEVLRAESGSLTSVALTVYDDGSTKFICFIPGKCFDIYEY